MSALRVVVIGFSVAATICTFAALLAAMHGYVTFTRLIEVPAFLVAIVAWWWALRIATRVSHGSKVDGIPGLAQIYGLGAAAIRAPAWALVLSVLSIVAIVNHGVLGRVHGMAGTTTEARITCTALLAFLLVSVPVLVSRHPGTGSIGGLTTRSSGR